MNMRPEFYIAEDNHIRGTRGEPAVKPAKAEDFAGPCERQNTAILCSDPEICRSLLKKGWFCIGLEREQAIPTAGDFSGVSVIFAGEGLPDAEWIMRQRCHYFGEPFSIYEKDGFCIRESTAQDFPFIFRMVDEAGLRIGGMEDPEEARETFLAYTANAYRIWDFGMYTVLKGTDRVGWCGLYPSSDPEGGAEMGFVIRAADRRKGYALAACREIIAYAVKQLGIERFLIKTKTANEAAASLAEKLHFQRIIPAMPEGYPETDSGNDQVSFLMKCPSMVIPSSIITKA